MWAFDDMLVPQLPDTSAFAMACLDAEETPRCPNADNLVRALPTPPTPAFRHVQQDLFGFCQPVNNHHAVPQTGATHDDTYTLPPSCASTATATFDTADDDAAYSHIVALMSPLAREMSYHSLGLAALPTKRNKAHVSAPDPPTPTNTKPATTATATTTTAAITTSYDEDNEHEHEHEHKHEHELSLDTIAVLAPVAIKEETRRSVKTGMQFYSMGATIEAFRQQMDGASLSHQDNKPVSCPLRVASSRQQRPHHHSTTATMTIAATTACTDITPPPPSLPLSVPRRNKRNSASMSSGEAHYDVTAGTQAQARSAMSTCLTPGSGVQVPASQDSRVDSRPTRHTGTLPLPINPNQSSLSTDHVIARGRRRRMQLATMTSEQKQIEAEARMKKNREIARNCRLRKKMKIDVLEGKVVQYEAEITEQARQISTLHKLVATLRNKGAAV